MLHDPRRGRLLLAVAFTMVLVPGALPADRILLRDGTLLNGTIEGQNRTHVRFRTGAQLRAIPKEQIRRIQYDEATSASGKKEAGSVAMVRAEEARRQEEARKQRESRKLEEARRKEEERKREELHRQKAAGKKEAARSETKPSTQDETGREPVGRTGALWRSVVLPGWGQYATGRTAEAFVAGGVSLAVLVRARALHAAALAAEDEYHSSALLYLLSPRLVPSSFSPDFAPGGTLNTSAVLLVGLLDRLSRLSYHEEVTRSREGLNVFLVVYGLQVLHAGLFVGDQPKPSGPARHAHLWVRPFAESSANGRVHRSLRFGITHVY